MIVIKHQYLALGMTSYNHATLVSVNVKWDVKTKRSRLSKHSFHIYSVSSLKFINLKKQLKKNQTSKYHTVGNQARHNRPRQPYICLPGLYIVYDLDDAICQLGLLSINRAVFCSCIAFSILLAISPALIIADYHQ